MMTSTIIGDIPGVQMDGGSSISPLPSRASQEAGGGVFFYWGFYGRQRHGAVGGRNGKSVK